MHSYKHSYIKEMPVCKNCPISPTPHPYKTNLYELDRGVDLNNTAAKALGCFSTILYRCMVINNYAAIWQEQ